MMKQMMLVTTLSLIFTNCAGIKTKQNARKSSSTPTATINQYRAQTQKNQLDQAIAKETISKRSEHFLRPVNNKKVNFWINYFSKRDPKGFEKHIRNGEKYRPIVEEIFKKHGLPVELYYVGLIESGYKNHARSHAGAVGPWQFVKDTAKRYGLRVTRSIDERKNIYKSTQAAALYFQDLYNIFGSWELALAAYNAGEYGVIRRIRGANTREYYELSKRKVLPKETRHYVPKIIAAMEVVKNAKTYGIKVKKTNSKYYQDVESYIVKGSTGLRKLARNLGISERVIKNLNHDIRTRYIPYMGKKGFEIYLPARSNKNKVERYLASLPKSGTRTKQARINSPKTTNAQQVHVVRSNESLYSISKRYGLSINSLKDNNDLSGSTIYPGQKLRLPISAYGEIKYSYTVKKGDNLSNIARVFNTKIKTLKKLNSLKRSKIYIGQKLKVPPYKRKHHIVNKGENLYTIARKYKVNINEIKKYNKIRRHIFPGQKLVVKINRI